jgi:GH24 family phage-related lysozyme (muramidase)
MEGTEMTIAIIGIDPATLTPQERNGLAILSHVTPTDLAVLKNLIHVGMPAVIGGQTLHGFVALCAEREIDLSDEGVNAFKDLNQLGNEGADHGAIGVQTAVTYFAVLVAGTPGPAAGGRHVTDNGLAVVENFEGLSLTAYRDQVGVATIGWGHTYGVQMGQSITHDQAVAFLRSDLAIAEECVAKYTTVPLNDNQFDALVSFTFNCGTGAYRGSTLLRVLNTGDYTGAADHFAAWCHGDRGPIQGLVERRAEERGLFLRP